MDIYLLIDGQQQGPYSEEQVRQSLAEGLIPFNLPAWHEGLEDWVQVESLVACPQGGARPLDSHEHAAKVDDFESTTSSLEFTAPHGIKWHSSACLGVATALFIVLITLWGVHVHRRDMFHRRQNESAVVVIEKTQSKMAVTPPDSAGPRNKIAWISPDRVIKSLEANGFTATANESDTYRIYNKSAPGVSESLVTVTIAIDIEQKEPTIDSYTIIRQSSPDSFEYDNQSFADANTAICGLFVSSDEWQTISEFINKPVTEAIKSHSEQKEFMRFRGALLEATCEVDTSPDTKRITQGFSIHADN